LASVAPAKLVAHWKLDDGSGLTAVDSSGNGFNGTLIGGPTWIVGAIDGGLEFDGRDDYVNFGNQASWPAGKAPRTLCGWGRTDTIASGYRWMAAYGSPVTGQAMFIGLNGSTLVAGGYGGDDVTVNNTWIVGEWCHVALTYDGSTAKAYLNGKEIGSVGKNWNLVLSRAHIGRQVNDAAEFWDGGVDDVRIYDTVLKAAEIKALVPPKVKARKPSPADGASGVVTPLFTWTPGETAVFDEIYFGETPDLTAADLVKRQPSAYKMWFCQETLVPGQRYYWRVESIEVGGTVHTGDTWSFFVTPQNAWAPRPADGATYVDPNVTLEWTLGLNATSHDVYFGADQAAVEAGTGDTKKVTQPTTTYSPGTLTRGATYYWRVDETATTKVNGEVWSFTVRPLIIRTDPNLLAWWKLDDEGSGSVVDYSGCEVYGVLMGDPQWVEGCYGDGLQFDGNDDYVDFGNPAGWPSGKSPRSMCGWAKSDSVAVGWRWIAAYGSEGTNLAMFIGMNGTDLYGGGYGNDILKANFWDVDVWHHICLTFNGTMARLYADGVEVTSAEKSVWNLALGRAHIGRQVNNYAEFWDGAVDDVRLYSKALTPEEIAQAMRGDTMLAWNPQPRNGINVDIRDAATLSWSPGETAAQHDIYLGTDKAAVKAAGVGSPEYLGRQTGTEYSVAGLVAFGGGSYFWRIDEVEADGTTVHKGGVWGFTVPDYLLVDEFETYTNSSPYRVFQTWIDGWGFSADDFFPSGNSGNGTGALVGYDPALGDIMETALVHGGGQSMPVEYNNVNQPYYSEVERTWAAQDWTVNGVTDLSLWFLGYPAGFTETASGITMSASGNDIWNNADQCRFAYRRLTGDGSIIAKVNSLEMTDGWAKAGVMIRESLTAESAHAATVVTPSYGVSFPWRAFTGDASNQVNQAGMTAPYWVKLTRTGNTFKAEHSPDGKTWSIIGADATLSSHDITMGSSVYVGLCLTSHNTGLVTVAQFSDIKTTGSVSGAWQVAELGFDHPGNDAAPLYVVVQDSAGKSAVVAHPDGNAVLATTWTEWKVPLTQFTGVSMNKVKKVYIGVGNRTAPQAGGSGKLYFDDIRVLKP